MFRFLKSTSRTVVHEEEEEKEEEKQKTSDDHGGGGCMTSLTVWTKSLVISCNGFTVIDSNGNLVYRVDNYSARPEEVTLMDASGKPVHTMRRRKVIDYIYHSSSFLSHFMLIMISSSHGGSRWIVFVGVFVTSIFCKISIKIHFFL